MALTNFEDITHDLSEIELKVVLPLVIKYLVQFKGEKNTITSAKVCQEWNNRRGDQYKMTGPRFRKMINTIRKNRLIRGLCSSSKGYFVAIEKKEIRKTLEHLIQRRNEMNNVIGYMNRDFIEWPDQNLFQS